MRHLYLRDSSSLQVDCVMMPTVMLNVSAGSTVIPLTVARQKQREAALLYKEDVL